MASRKTAPEVLQISPDGLRVTADGCEYFLSFKTFPAFENAPVGQVLNVTIQGDRRALRWPDLGATIALDSLEPVDPLAFLK